MSLVVVKEDELVALSRAAGPMGPSTTVVAYVERVDVSAETEGEYGYGGEIFDVSVLNVEPSDSGRFFREVET